MHDIPDDLRMLGMVEVKLVVSFSFNRLTFSPVLSGFFSAPAVLAVPFSAKLANPRLHPVWLM